MSVQLRVGAQSRSNSTHRRSPIRRTWKLVGVLTVALALLPAPASAAKPAEPSRPSENRSELKGDSDGNKLFDDLEAVLGPLNPGDKVPVIVTLTAPATQSRVDRLRTEEGDFQVGHRFSIIQAFSATMPRSRVVALARRPDVVHVEHDSGVTATNESAQASFGVTAARDQVAGLTGAGLAAAVIDTGIDPNHQDIAGRVVAFKDYVNNRTTAYDDNGHGTHVAGTIAANVASPNTGVAPAATLVGVKVLDSAGSGSMANVTAGIDWVVANSSAHNIVAINLSLGTVGCANGTDATSQAVNRAVAAGMVVVVAAGNDGAGACTIGSPGAAAGAVTVGAMADLGRRGFHQATFSSRGPTADGRTKPDVSAPGVRITSAAANTAAGYSTMSGTSMATPFVAGVALLMRQLGATPADVKAKMMSTAQDWGTTGPDNDYGAGRLDAYAALAAVAGPSLSMPPAVPAHSVRAATLSGTGAVRDFPLTVTDMSFPVAATLLHSSVSTSTSTSPDFDLYLLGPDGAVLDSSESSRRQEDVGAKPGVAGTYTVRVKSYNGSGAYQLDLSGGAPGDVTCAGFSDVSPDHQFCAEIRWMASSGITTGFADGTFRPTSEVTREAMAAFMYRFAGSPPVEPCSKAPFSDVPADHHFCREITWMAGTGITNGFSDGTFRPLSTVAREAMAAFMYRFAGFPPVEPCSKAPFSDVPANHHFCKEITWMAGTGITNGFADGTFRPLSTVAREAMSAFMYRFANK